MSKNVCEERPSYEELRKENEQLKKERATESKKLHFARDVAHFHMDGGWNRPRVKKIWC